MMHLIRLVLGWGLFLLIAVITAGIIIASPHGSARLVTTVNHRVGTFASAVASQLPRPASTSPAPGRP